MAGFAGRQRYFQNSYTIFSFYSFGKRHQKELVEVKLFRSGICDFIHTWHFHDIPNFLAAVVPELEAGFMFYRGDSRDGELYEDERCVRLRYYLDRKKMKNAKVHFKDGKVFESPKDNTEIIDHLRVFVKNHPSKLLGKEIVNIEEFKR